MQMIVQHIGSHLLLKKKKIKALNTVTEQEKVVTHYTEEIAPITKLT